MKRVIKTGPPHAYKEWRKKVRGTQDEHYQIGLRNPLKRELHTALVTEQGYLCAYTMKRIRLETSHIEHIKPESLCRADRAGSDLDYENMVACFPRYGMSRRYRYGAQKRDDWWENNGVDFVTPLDVNCEKRFIFDLEGNINSKDGHPAAAQTIKKLGLNHATLTEDRRRVIREYMYGKEGDDPLSLAMSHQGFMSICSLDNQGEYLEFCVAIRDALKQHMRNLEKNHKKKKFTRKR